MKTKNMLVLLVIPFLFLISCGSVPDTAPTQVDGDCSTWLETFTPEPGDEDMLVVQYLEQGQSIALVEGQPYKVCSSSGPEYATMVANFGKVYLFVFEIEGSQAQSNAHLSGPGEVYDTHSTVWLKVSNIGDLYSVEILRLPDFGPVTKPPSNAIQEGGIDA